MALSFPVLGDLTISDSGPSMQVALSEAMRVSLKVPVGGADGQGVAAVLTRQHFEKLATPLFERMRLAVDEACWQV